MGLISDALTGFVTGGPAGAVGAVTQHTPLGSSIAPDTLGTSFSGSRNAGTNSMAKRIVLGALTGGPAGAVSAALNPSAGATDAAGSTSLPSRYSATNAPGVNSNLSALAAGDLTVDSANAASAQQLTKTTFDNVKQSKLAQALNIVNSGAALAAKAAKGHWDDMKQVM